MEREDKVQQAKDMHAKLTNKQRENQKSIKKKWKKVKDIIQGRTQGGPVSAPDIIYI